MVIILTSILISLWQDFSLSRVILLHLGVRFSLLWLRWSFHIAPFQLMHPASDLSTGDLSGCLLLEHLETRPHHFMWPIRFLTFQPFPSAFIVLSYLSAQNWSYICVILFPYTLIISKVIYKHLPYLCKIDIYSHTMYIVWSYDLVIII